MRSIWCSRMLLLCLFKLIHSFKIAGQLMREKWICQKVATIFSHSIDMMTCCGRNSLIAYMIYTYASHICPNNLSTFSMHYDKLHCWHEKICGNLFEEHCMVEYAFFSFIFHKWAIECIFKTWRDRVLSVYIIIVGVIAAHSNEMWFDFIDMW